MKITFLALSLLAASVSVNAEWLISEDTDEMTGKSDHYASSGSVSPTKPIRGTYSDVKSWIGVGCNTDKDIWIYNGHTSLNIVGGKYVAGIKAYDRRVKFDGGDIQSLMFIKPSTSNFLLLRDGSGGTMRFVNSIKKNNNVLIESNWYKSGDSMFRFDLKGSTKAVNKIFSKCGIK